VYAGMVVRVRLVRGLVCDRQQARRSSSLSHVFVEELTMEVVARRVVDEALLVLGLVSTLVLEHGVVIPSTPYACASWSELEQR